MICQRHETVVDGDQRYRFDQAGQCHVLKQAGIGAMNEIRRKGDFGFVSLKPIGMADREPRLLEELWIGRWRSNLLSDRPAVIVDNREAKRCCPAEHLLVFATEFGDL